MATADDEIRRRTPELADELERLKNGPQLERPDTFFEAWDNLHDKVRELGHEILKALHLR